VSEKMFSREQYEQLRSFPEISRDELFRYFTLTSAEVAFVDPGAGRGSAAATRARPTATTARAGQSADGRRLTAGG
jgi:hypothetical protein